MKYCSDCKHFAAAHHWYPFDMCYHPDTRDPVGRFRTAGLSRCISSPCGPDGLLWEFKLPKPPEPPPSPSWWQRIRIAFSAGEP